MWFPFKKIQIAPVATIAEIEIFLSQRCLSLLSLPSLLSLNSVFPYIATVAETRFSTTVAIAATGAIIWKPTFTVCRFWNVSHSICQILTYNKYKGRKYKGSRVTASEQWIGDPNRNVCYLPNCDAYNRSLMFRNVMIRVVLLSWHIQS